MRESRTLGSARAKAEWLLLDHRPVGPVPQPTIDVAHLETPAAAQPERRNLPILGQAIDRRLVAMQVTREVLYVDDLSTHFASQHVFFTSGQNGLQAI